METIFIAVSAYNEPHIKLMIDNCLENSEFPERIHFGLWLHNNDDNAPILNGYSNIKVVSVNYQSPLGCAPGRLNAIGLYEDQDYYMQLDGHMLFEKNWDTKIISSFKQIQAKHDKPIITTFSPWWSMTDGKVNFYSNESDVVCEPMTIDIKSSIKEGYPKPKIDPYQWKDEETYKEHHCISGAFIFTIPSFIVDILPDPLIMFSGEEMTTAVRAWSRGYRMFCIKNPIVWHLNKFDGDRYEKDRLWDKRNSNKYFIHYIKKDYKSVFRSKKILTGEILGYWGVENKKDLEDYTAASGIDFIEVYRSIEAGKDLTKRNGIML